MNRYELLRDLFVWAYERSTNEYIAVRKSLAKPDPLRLRYRMELHEGIIARYRIRPSEFTAWRGARKL